MVPEILISNWQKIAFKLNQPNFITNYDYDELLRRLLWLDNRALEHEQVPRDFKDLSFFIEKIQSYSQ